MPMKDQTASTGGIRIVPNGVLIGSCVLLGLAILVLATEAPALLLLVPLALIGVSFLLMARDRPGFLLAAYFVTVPIAVSKSLAAYPGAMSPSLELTPADLLLLALAVVWLKERKRRVVSLGRWERLLRWPVGLFFAWAWFSAFHAVAPERALMSALNLTKYLGAYLLVAELVTTPRRLRWVLWGVALGLVLQVGMSALQVATRSQLILPGMKTVATATMGYRLDYAGVAAWRPSGLLQHPNFLASYLVAVIPTLFLLMALGAKRLGTAAWYTSAVLLVAASATLLLTLSRAGWVAGVVAGAAVVFIGLRRGVLKHRRLVALAFGAVVALGAILPVYPAVLYRVTRGDDRSAESRLLMLSQASLVIQSHPVIGWGLSSYQAAAKQNVPPSFAPYGKEFLDRVLSSVVHNAYMVTWAERGIIGVVLLLAFHLTHCVAGFRLKYWVDPVYAALGWGIAASIVGLLVNYNLDHFYLDSRPGVIWPMLGLLVAVLRLNATSVGQVLLPGQVPQS